MRMSVSRFLSLVFAAPLAALAGADAPFAEYPEFDFETAQPVLVAARVAPGAALPNFRDVCPPDKVCIQLHYPEWFRANVLMTVYGPQMPKQMAVATVSHYGQSRYEGVQEPWLINLFVKDGKVAVMPVNSFYGLVQRSDGEWFLPVTARKGPFFLPCSVSEIWEELGPQQYRPALESIERKEYTWRYVEEDLDLYVIAKDKAVPRYGIRMTRLQDFLRGKALEHSRERCVEPEVVDEEEDSDD